jgi:hypothetical protein
MTTALRLTDLPKTGNLRVCRSCWQTKRIPDDFYPIGLNGRGVMRFRLKCRDCHAAKVRVTNKIRYAAEKAGKAAHRAHRRATDPDIQRYREEKRNAAPRLARRQKSVELQIHRMVELMATATAHGFYLPPRALTF